MKRNHLAIMLIFIISIMFTITVYAEDFTVATGKPTLSYHNKQFNLFKNAVKRFGGDDYDVEYAFPKKRY